MEKSNSKNDGKGIQRVFLTAKVIQAFTHQLNPGDSNKILKFRGQLFPDLNSGQANFPQFRFREI